MVTVTGLSVEPKERLLHAKVINVVSCGALGVQSLTTPLIVEFVVHHPRFFRDLRIKYRSSQRAWDSLQGTAVEIRCRPSAKVCLRLLVPHNDQRHTKKSAAARLNLDAFGRPQVLSIKSQGKDVFMFKVTVVVYDASLDWHLQDSAAAPSTDTDAGWEDRTHSQRLDSEAKKRGLFSFMARFSSTNPRPLHETGHEVGALASSSGSSGSAMSAGLAPAPRGCGQAAPAYAAHLHSGGDAAVEAGQSIDQGATAAVAAARAACDATDAVQPASLRVSSLPCTGPHPKRARMENLTRWFSMRPNRLQPARQAGGDNGSSDTSDRHTAVHSAMQAPPHDGSNEGVMLMGRTSTPATVPPCARRTQSVDGRHPERLLGTTTSRSTAQHVRSSSLVVRGATSNSSDSGSDTNGAAAAAPDSDGEQPPVVPLARRSPATSAVAAIAAAAMLQDGPWAPLTQAHGQAYDRSCSRYGSRRQSRTSEADSSTSTHSHGSIRSLSHRPPSAPPLGHPSCDGVVIAAADASTPGGTPRHTQGGLPMPTGGGSPFASSNGAKGVFQSSSRASGGGGLGLAALSTAVLPPRSPMAASVDRRGSSLPAVSASFRSCHSHKPSLTDRLLGRSLFEKSPVLPAAGNPAEHKSLSPMLSGPQDMDVDISQPPLSDTDDILPQVMPAMASPSPSPVAMNRLGSLFAGFRSRAAAATAAAAAAADAAKHVDAADGCHSAPSTRHSSPGRPALMRALSTVESSCASICQGASEGCHQLSAGALPALVVPGKGSAVSAPILAVVSPRGGVSTPSAAKWRALRREIEDVLAHVLSRPAVDDALRLEQAEQCRFLLTCLEDESSRFVAESDLDSVKAAVRYPFSKGEAIAEEPGWFLRSCQREDGKSPLMVKVTYAEQDQRDAGGVHACAATALEFAGWCLANPTAPVDANILSQLIEAGCGTWAERVMETNAGLAAKHGAEAPEQLMALGVDGMFDLHDMLACPAYACRLAVQDVVYASLAAASNPPRVTCQTASEQQETQPGAQQQQQQSSAPSMPQSIPNFQRHMSGLPLGVYVVGCQEHFVVLCRRPLAAAAPSVVSLAPPAPLPHSAALSSDGGKQGAVCAIGSHSSDGPHAGGSRLASLATHGYVASNGDEVFVMDSLGSSLALHCFHGFALQFSGMDDCIKYFLSRHQAVADTTSNGCACLRLANATNLVELHRIVPAPTVAQRGGAEGCEPPSSGIPAVLPGLGELRSEPGWLAPGALWLGARVQQQHS